jgi:hypothetical protein
MAAMSKEHIHFLKRAFVKQHVDTLAAGVRTLSVMFLNSSLTASGLRFLAVLY